MYINGETIVADSWRLFYGYDLDFWSARFTYNPKTGTIVGRQGRPLKARDMKGYSKVGVKPYKDEKQLHVYGHRLAWFLHYGWLDPERSIDHVDHDPTNNRIDNLRSVTMQENNRNKRLYKNGRAIEPGVYLDSYENYRVIISKRHYGKFDKLEHAVAVAAEVRRVLGFHENHGQVA